MGNIEFKEDEDYLYFDPDYPLEMCASRRSRFWRG